jgi:hypothetical protein
MKRVAPERVVDGVPDGAAGVGKTLDRGLGIDHPGPDREILFPEILPEVNEPGSGVRIDYDRARVELAAKDRHVSFF